MAMRSCCCARWSKRGEVRLANRVPEAPAHGGEYLEKSPNMFADRRIPLNAAHAVGVVQRDDMNDFEEGKDAQTMYCRSERYQ